METRNLVLAIAGAILIVACSALAMGWKQVAEDAMRAQRECVATGEVHVAALPRLEIGTDIMFQGDRLISADLVAHDDSPTFKIDALFERMDGARKHTCDSNKICIDNLAALSFDEPNIRVLKKVVNTAWAAGYDVVLRPQHDQRSW